MNLSWSPSRNSFHGAWLLLGATALLEVFAQFLFEAGDASPNDVLRWTLLLLISLPAVIWRSRLAPGAVLRFLKECRAQMPGFLVAVLVPRLTTLGDGQADPRLLAFGFGCFLMGASAFGNEMGYRTLATWLAQPQSRFQLYGSKMRVLLVLLVLAWGHFLLLGVGDKSSYGLYAKDPFLEATLVVLMSFTGAPFFSLVCRSTLAGFVFAWAAPLGLALVGSLLESAFQIRIPLGWSVLVYALITGGWGSMVFRTLQAHDGGSQQTIRVHRLGLNRVLDTVLFFLSPVLPWNPGLVQLIRKELSLQVIPWLVSAIMVGLSLVWWGIRATASDADLLMSLRDVGFVLRIAAILAFLLILGTGASCVAEERELGTLEWQLTQPISHRCQWIIKWLVATVLSLALGVVLPAALLWIGFSTSELKETLGHLEPWQIFSTLGVLMFLLGLSIYASSLSRNTMTAMALSVGITASLAGVIALVAWYARVEMEAQYALWHDRDVYAVAPAWAPTQQGIRTLLNVLGVMVCLGLILSLLRLSASNFRRQFIPQSRILSQILLLLVSLGVIGMSGVKLLAELQGLRSRADIGALSQSEVLEWTQTLEQAPVGLVPQLRRHFAVAEEGPWPELINAIRLRHGRGGLLELMGILRSWPPQNPVQLRRVRQRYGLEPVPSSQSPNPAENSMGSLHPFSPEMQKRFHSGKP